jgi:1-hydroxycarotenoid 3,4-desaturase
VQPDAPRSVIVIGAGAGGLAATCDLARQGVSVTVFESADQIGGRIHAREVAGRWIDAGPTVLTMRWVFDDLLAACGETLEDEGFRLQPLAVLARHAWSEHEQLDLFADNARSVDAVGRFAGADEARRFEQFCAESSRTYHALEAAYIRAERPTLSSMMGDLGPRGLIALAGLGPFASLWASLGRRFRDERLQQLFARYATYCGGSPWLSPATLMLIAYVEQRGVWVAQGGMRSLAARLARTASRLGAKIHCASRVAEITVDGGRATGVVLSDGSRWAADALIFNGEAGALGRGLLGAAAARAVEPHAYRERSLSALTFAITGTVEGFEPDYHNVFFQPNYASEFSDIFNASRLPSKPTIYLCAQDRLPPGADSAQQARAPGPKPERLFFLINAPAAGPHGAAADDEEIRRCEHSAFSHLARCGLTLQSTATARIVTTPQGFAQRFPGSDGALYGMAPHGWMSSFRRPRSQSLLPGLYLAGGSAHPGAGVPMATLSGRLAAATLMAHLDSTRRSSRVRISGGMSMG